MFPELLERCANWDDFMAKAELSVALMHYNHGHYLGDAMITMLDFKQIRTNLPRFAACCQTADRINPRQ
jgi:hypothetical protein